MSVEFGVVARAALACISEEELATKAADDMARGQTFVMEIHDKHHHEIVIGHVLVAVLYGSEEQVRKIQAAINSAGRVLSTETDNWGPAK